MINEFLAHIKAGQDLSSNDAADLLGALLDDESASEEQITEFLSSTTKKKPTIDEILGFIDAMQARMMKIQAPDGSIDMCGTGGDKSNSFNISTAASIVVVSTGIPVAKHGNRSASSKCGSADVLEELGVRIDLEPDQAEKQLRDTNFVFLFAQKYHPSLKRLAMIRKQLGYPTIFNILGPLLNPASVKRQVIGTFSHENAEIIAEVIKQRDYDKALVVVSQDGLDEISVSAPTSVIEITSEASKSYEIKPSDFGLAGSKDDLVGGDAKENAQIVTDMFVNKSLDSSKAKITALNAAAGLYVAGSADSLEDCFTIAAEAISSGKATEKLNEIINYGS